MLSFRALSEKKTKIKINPKQSEITEMENNHGEDCDCMKCERKRRKGEKEPEVANESAVPGKPAERLGAVTAIPKDERDAAAERLKAKAAAKRKAKGIEEGYYDPMEDPDFDHDEAEATRGQSGKNKSITIKKKTKKTTKEETAYVSQEEVSEESNQSIAETETLLTFGQFLAEMPFQVMGSPDGKKEKKIGKPVKSKKYADARAAELADTHKATGGKYRSQYVEEIELEEGRSEDAQVSLAKVKARQKVLDAHEKKTGRKLDIAKTPEHKAHKKEFPGAKRTGKKVPGAKETAAETQRRQTNRQVSRVVKHGYTSKEKKEVESMAKHTSSRD